MIGFSRKLRNLIPILIHSKLTPIFGALILLLAVPLTVIVSQQQQTTKQRASGFEDNAVNIVQDASQDLNQVSGNPKGCGDKCAEEPPLPSGIMTVNYCSQPLIIPGSEVTDEYKSYQNVKNNRDRKDNRYFIYVSKDNADPVKVKVGGVTDVVVEQLVGDPVSFDGGSLTITGSGAFAIHGNPSKTSAIGFCAFGAFCSYEDLSLKVEKSKNRIYPSDNCAQLSASISYMAAKKSIDGDGGTGKGLLYAALNKVVDKVFEAQAHVIERSAPISSLVSPATPTTDKVVVNIDMQMGGDPVPLIEGMTYAGATFTKGEAVQPALEFARGLRNLPTPEAKIAAINKWVAENGVYPTEEVIMQLIRDGKFDLAEFASRFFKQSSNSPVSQFSYAEETLDNLMSTKLPDGRFMCVCRDASVLGVAMAQEAGVQAWPVEGNMTDKPVVSQDLQALNEAGVSGKGHAWVEFRDSQGKIVGWDITYALSTDLTTPPKIYNHEFTSAKFPNDFKYSRLLSIPDVFVGNGDILNLSIVDSEGRIVPHRILNFQGAFGLVIEGYRDKEKLTYKIEFKLKDSSKIATVSLASSAGTDISLSSSKFSVSTNSKTPIIVDTGRELTPFNQELLSKETADGIKKYNKARSEFIRNHPNTPAELLKTQEQGLTFLKMLLVDADSWTLTKEEATFLLKDAVARVEQRMTALNPEGKMQVVPDTLATAENSPLKGKGMMSLASLKANRSMLFTKGVGVGSNMANILGSPVIADLANSLDNAYLITAARATNVVGMGEMVVMGGKTVAQAAIAANVAFKGASGALAARTAAGGVAAGAAVGGTAVAFAGQTAIAAVGTSFATTLYCATNPTSSMCGCRISGEYGENKLALELHKYDVAKGEKVKYRILGFENCPTHVGLEAVFGMVNLANARAPEPKLTTGKDGNARNPIGGEGAQCKWQPDGRWCLGEFTANLDKGSYRLTILQPQILVGNQNPLYLYPHDTGQMLNVDGGGNTSVKLIPSGTPAPKISSTPTPTVSVLSPFSAYNQCLTICDQGELISQNFDKTACIQNCDIKFKQSSLTTITPAPTVKLTPRPTARPATISPAVSVSPVVSQPTATPFPTVIPLSSSAPTPTPIPQASCPVSLTKADANCYGGIDMNDFNKQRDYAIAGQITEEQLKLWISDVWSPAFLSQ